ncbi:facilitated trehalose transporter Tret1-like [Vanessa tameamea]|uniref:Facilitated trehalose transporter Tret1-like n=1 Tax=Vanessa tameamea TaxID=334116 RepID=A0A8B8I4N7_VANTA|nr:facilitated trehalose transporter Tret1-like [Vanessa tameamea]XP_026491950.1 facilitated trehalose transporter Tret1-like [Vanessa tameamea]XP_046972585.1 facilitated trehalose transporter Tret1-like [Vanessa cardui]XP_046972586.1 facilitated trehalose transporter Tret1-like [Vanessa cardui]XP_047539392.1 facilitated trehalose transporter Tret1-like [Vanessa atalanta]
MSEKECLGKMTNITPETRIMMMRGEDGRQGYRRQILAALAVSLGPFAAGLSKGYMSPAIASMQEDRLHKGSFTVSDQQASWIASLSLLGALVGGILGGMAMRIGRRSVLLMTALPYTVAWLATALSTSVDMISVTSFCGGMLVCCITMITQVYVTEIAVPEIRGCLSSVLKILSQIGFLISFSLGAYLNWHQLALVVAAAPVLLFLALLFIPETPSSLLLRGKEEEAADSLQWLRGPDADIRQELATIRTNILASKQYHDGRAGKFKVLLSKRLTRPVLITCGLMFFQRFTGAHVFNFYAVSIFKKTFRMMNPHGGAIATSVVQLLASCLSGMLIDNVGRLPLLMISGVMMSIAFAGFGSYAYYDYVFRNTTDLTQTVQGSYDWIPLLCVLTFTIAFSLGIGPISSLLIGELFPLEYRSTGSALATSFSHLCGFVNVKTAADFQYYIGLYGLFWMYAGLAVLCLLFVVLFVPETKGREIDEMDPKYVESLCINR